MTSLEKDHWPRKLDELLPDDEKGRLPGEADVDAVRARNFDKQS